MLNSKQRAFLRKEGHTLDPIFQVGKGGVSEEMALQISNALEARELIKVRVLDNSGYSAREAAEELSSLTLSEVVSCVGYTFILYKKSEKKQRIFLP